MQVTLAFSGGSTAEVLEQLKAFLNENGQGSVAPPAEVKKPAKKAETKNDPAPEEKTSAQSGEEEVTVDTLRSAWATKKDAGAKTSTIIAIFDKYGVKKLDEFKVEDRAAVLADINAIK